MILIISYSFPPDNVPAAQRPYFMAKYLNKLKCETLVLTSGNSLSSIGKSQWADISGLKIFYAPKFVKKPVNTGSESVNRSSSVFLNKFRAFVSKEFLIPDKGVHWMLTAKRDLHNILKNNPEIRYVYSTSPSYINHILAMWVKMKFKKRWIADFRDFYYVKNIQDKSFIFRKQIDRYIERRILKKSDAVTFTSTTMFKAYSTEYPSIKSKFSVIFNGFDADEFADLPGPKINDFKIKIFYGGSFYEGVRSPGPLLLSLQYLIEKKMLTPNEIEIRIAGNIPKEIFAEFQSLDIYSSIIFLGPIPRLQVLNEMKSCMLTWLIVGNQPSHYGSVPVKGYEYIGARRFILNFCPEEGECRRIINELNCGLNLGVGAGDIPVNASKLNIIFSSIKDRSLSIPVEINSILLKKYTREYQGYQLKQLIDSLK